MKESQTIGFKENWRDDCLKTICAFANTEGGELYVGINDKGEIVGLSYSNLKKAMEDIPNQAKDKLGILVFVQIMYEGDKEYLKVEVAKSLLPISYNGSTYIRSGSTTQRLDGFKQNRLFIERTGYSWDCHELENVKLSDLDSYWIGVLKKQGIQKGRITPSAKDEDDESFLTKMNLMNEGKITRGALLLFHEHPQHYISGCETKIGRFSDNEELLFQDLVDGPLLYQADKVIDLIMSKYTIAPVTFEGFKRVELNPFPEKAIREAVYNALAHNDYSQGIPIQIKIYDSKIEITNSGVLPTGWTLKDLEGEHRSEPMNFKIAAAFYRAGLIEAWGSGVRSIFRICKEYGCPKPEYLIKNDKYITLRLFASKSGDNKESLKKSNPTVNEPHVIVFTGAGRQNREDQLLNILTDNPKLKRDELAQILGVSLSTIKRCLNSLVEKGMLVRIGNTSNQEWRIVK